MIVKKYNGQAESDHRERRDQRRQNGSDPGYRYQEQNVPGEQGLRPVKQDFQKNVVEDIPDAERKEKQGKPENERPCAQRGNRGKHDNRAEFAEDFCAEHLFRDALQRETEPAGEIQLAQIDHDNRFENAHGNAEQSQPEHAGRERLLFGIELHEGNYTRYHCQVKIREIVCCRRVFAKKLEKE